MNDSSLNATEIAVGSLLAGNRGGYGGYGGAWSGGGGGYSPFASPGSNAVRINRNNEVTKGEGDCTRRVLGLGLDRISDQAEESRRSAQFTGIRDGQFQAELRNGDRLRDIEREIANNARVADKCCCDVQKAIADAAKDAAKCCCDAQLQQCKDTAELKALVIEENSKTRELIRGDALAAANAKITQLETINALSGHHHR